MLDAAFRNFNWKQLVPWERRGGGGGEGGKLSGESLCWNRLFKMFITNAYGSLGGMMKAEGIRNVFYELLDVDNGND